MYCTECGTENRNDRKFCTNCGKPLRDYTKPRENLLMPEDISKAQENVKKKNTCIKRLNIATIISLILATICLVVAFFTESTVRYTLTFVSVGFALVACILIIAKATVIKKFNKKNN